MRSNSATEFALAAKAAKLSKKSKSRPDVQPASHPAKKSAGKKS